MGYRVSRVFAIVLVLMLAVPLGAFAQSSAGKVVEIDITGNKSINSETIQNAITLKVGDDYDDQTIDKDKASITSLGYFSAVTVHKDDVNGGVKVTYEVTENPKIADIKIVGNDPVPADKILAIMKTKPGQVLNSNTLNQDIEAIQNYYGQEGYIAYITEDVGVDAKTGVLTIPVLVHRVESVEITGNKKTKDYVFYREMKTQPGKIFNVKTLKEDIVKIYNLDILEDIKPYQINPGSDVGLVKIVIPVVEKKTGNVSVGFGYSSKQRLVGQAKLAETNFQGKGQGLNLLWEQGTTAAVGGSGSYEAGFMEPWLDKKNTSLSVNGYSKILYRFSNGVFNSGSDFAGTDEPYNERHTGGDVTLSRLLNEKTRFYYGARFENVNIASNLLTNNVNSVYADPTSTAEQKAYALSQAKSSANIVNSGPVVVGSLRLVHNTRDFDMDPAAGAYDGVSVEFGSINGSKYYVPESSGQTVFYTQPVAFNGAFEKISFDFRRYFSKGGRKTTPQDKRVTLATRFMFGFAGGSLPFFEQFFVGGSESLRGYQEDRFWGTKMLLASVELRKPIAQSIAGVLFVDWGDAWGGQIDNPPFNGLSQSTGFTSVVGYGIGMRVTTPIGHLRLDYGIGSEGSRTHFSMGQAF